MSNIIKSHRYVALGDKKKLKVRPLLPAQPKQEQNEPKVKLAEHKPKSEAEKQAELEAAKIIQQAKEKAEELYQTAYDEAEKLRKQTQVDIDESWQQQQATAEELAAKARQDGFETGMEEGRAEAEEQVKAAYEEKLRSAEQIVKQAYIEKNKIIYEAEPFLLQLSTEIAQKVLSKQLTLEPSWILNGIKNVLQQRRDQGSVTLCVAPEQFEWVSEAKAELLLAMDSEADLQIIPDPRVQDEGCIVRSAYGSIDARLDTQLVEIKRALIEMMHTNEEAEAN